MNLIGRRILVTGGSSGIGLGLTRFYAAEGATVWTVARRADALAETAQATGRITPIAADLSTPDGRALVAETVSSDTDALDVAVHAAGILGPPGVTLERYPKDAWYAVFEANVSAVHFLHQSLAPLHHAADVPTVIGISSSVGRKGRALWGMYSVSKFALEGWLETLADEWGPAGKVYSVNPGATATPMRATAAPDEDPSTLPTPDDIGPLFLRLAHASCPEPSGTKFEARDWIGRDPWKGL